MKCASRFITIGRADALTYVCRGRAYAKGGEYRLAIADYDTALALDPEYAEAYFNRGSAYLALGIEADTLAVKVTYFQQSMMNLRQAAALGYVLPSKILAIMSEIELLLPTPAPVQ